MLKPKQQITNFADKQTLHEALARLEPAAIRHLSERLAQSIKFLPGVYHLSIEDMEELRNDALLVTLQKLTDGEFQFQGFEPATYATAVARRLLANRLRKRQLDTVELDGHDREVDLDPEQYFLQKEAELALGEKLKALGGNCEQLIRLKYFDNLKDQEVVDRKLAPYSTVDSLKNRRSQCLKKLAELLRQGGERFLDIFK